MADADAQASAFVNETIAVVQYMDDRIEMIVPGTHVVCAVTGALIHLDDLLYWNVDKQEAYSNAEAAMKRFRELR